MCNHFQARNSASDGPWGPIPLIFTPFFSPLIFQTVSQSMTTSTKSLSCFGSDRPSCCSTGAGLSCVLLTDTTSRYAWLQSSAVLRNGRCSCCGMRLVWMHRSWHCSLTEQPRRCAIRRRSVKTAQTTTGCHRRSPVQVCSAEAPAVDLQRTTHTTTQDQSSDCNKSYTKVGCFRFGSVAGVFFFIISCFRNHLVRQLV